MHALILCRDGEPNYLDLLALDGVSFELKARVKFATRGPATVTIHGIFRQSN